MDSDAESQISGSLPGTPPLTQRKAQSKISYAWVILFNMNVDKETPFKIFRLTLFKDINFPWDCIKSDMSQQFRQSIHRFTNMPNERVCVFAKIERGNFFFKLS